MKLYSLCIILYVPMVVLVKIAISGRCLPKMTTNRFKRVLDIACDTIIALLTDIKLPTIIMATSS